MARCEECDGRRGFYDAGPGGIWTECEYCGGSGEGDDETYELAARRERECRVAYWERNVA